MMSWMGLWLGLSLADTCAPECIATEDLWAWPDCADAWLVGPECGCQCIDTPTSPEDGTTCEAAASADTGRVDAGDTGRAICVFVQAACTADTCVDHDVESASGCGACSLPTGRPGLGLILPVAMLARRSWPRR